MKTEEMKKLNEQTFTKQEYMLSFEGGNIATERNGDYVEKYGCDSQRTGFILIYDTCSCIANYSPSKEKGITFLLAFLIKVIMVISTGQIDLFKTYSHSIGILEVI